MGGTLSSRRKGYWIWVSLSLSFVLSASAVASGEENQVQARSVTVSYLKGKAEMQRGQSAPWEIIRAGSMLREGDRARTFEATRLELTLEDRSVIRFGERTNFILVQMKGNSRTRQSNSRIFLLLGKIWANVNKTAGLSSTFEIQTQTAIAGTRATIYRLSLLDDKSTVVKVYEGSIEVASAPKEVPPPAAESGPHEVPGPAEIPPPFHEVSIEEWTEIVGTMEQITISPQGIPGKKEKILTEMGEEEWVAWNKERDKGVSFSK
jgi:ferric-dicitrate binding protein FerR (iron transport regulator)